MQRGPSVPTPPEAGARRSPRALVLEPGTQRVIPLAGRRLRARVLRASQRSGPVDLALLRARLGRLGTAPAAQGLQQRLQRTGR